MAGSASATLNRITSGTPEASGPPLTISRSHMQVASLLVIVRARQLGSKGQIGAEHESNLGQSFIDSSVVLIGLSPFLDVKKPARGRLGSGVLVRLLTSVHGYVAVQITANTVLWSAVRHRSVATTHCATGWQPRGNALI